MIISLNLPWPPTSNKIWRTGQSKTYNSKEYQAFLNASFFEIKSQLPRWHKVITGEVRVTIRLFPPSKRKYDVDNRVKPTLDALTKAGVWEDDSQVQILTVSKCYPQKPGMAMVDIEEIENEQRNSTTNAKRRRFVR